MQRILDQLAQMEGRLTDAMVGHCSELERRFADSEQKSEARFISLEMDQAQFEGWRPEVEKRLDNIALELHRANKFMERGSMATDLSKPGIIPSSTSAFGRTQIGNHFADGPDGNRFADNHRDRGFGRDSPQPHGPVKGKLPELQPHDLDTSEDVVRDTEGMGAREEHQGGWGNLPRLNFPSFDGDNPQLWKSLCENYFDMYEVPSARWVRVATMHFSGRAAGWLQSVGRRVRCWSWSEFCTHIQDRFGRDQHESLIRQLFHIRQSGSVAEYVEQFSILVDHLSAYETHTDHLYYTMRFIDGLNDDIKSVIMVQRPATLDTACSLALVQEEALASGRGHRSSYTASRSVSGMNTGSSSLPKWDQYDDRLKPMSNEDKLASLRRFRRARGLCDRCAEKWTHGHKCATTAQLHAMDEVWALLVPEEPEPPDDKTEPSTEEQSFMMASQTARGLPNSTKTLVLQGCLQDMSILILLDSGSSHSFLHDRFHSLLSNVQFLPTTLSVRVANGSVIHCQQKVLQLPWSIQGYSFFTDVTLLPIPVYDMILGMDWLQDFSPMRVHWTQKWLSIPYNGASVTIHGQAAAVPECTIVQLLLVTEHTTASVDIVPQPVQSILQQFQQVFEDPRGLPPSRECDHTIPLVDGAQPFSVKSYRYPPQLKDEIEQQIADMLKQGVIQKSHSPFASPVLLVRKKDNTWRFCVDYRYLNAITIKSKYPVPVFDQLMDELSHSSWFSKLDLKAGYHQILLQNGEEYKTAFQTHMGHYEFRVMAFGLTGAPNTFLEAMNETLKPVLRRCALVFFDDILIYSKSFEEHLLHLSEVLHLLLQDHWKVKLTKCDFAKQQISYLGHVISVEGVSTDPEKVRVVEQWPTPTNAKELRSFLGLAGFYRKFVKHFGIISRPLFNLLKKNTIFVWTLDHQQAFNSLKIALVTAPVLALPDFSKIFSVHTDACQFGVGAILMQQDHPLAFLSKALGPKNQGLSTYEKEYMAILLAVNQWRSYLQLAEFWIYTDHISLTQLNTQRLHTPWQQKVYTKLVGLQYKIVYRKGKDNAAADALSRLPHPTASCHAISASSPAWLHDVIAVYDKNPEAQKLLASLSVQSTPNGPFTLHQGVIRYKGRIWLAGNLELQQRVIAAMHDSAIGGHSGVPVTHCRLKKLFYWPGMKQAVQDYVQSCTVCQQAKAERVRYPGLLQPLPVPPQAWHTISLDFIEGLPRSANANCILVVVDKFSKYGHFLPLSHPFTAAKVAKVFLDNVYKLHGLPVNIISDRDRIFTSSFWQTLFQLSGTQLCMSSSYHPQSDGQTERLNQCLETFLRCFVHTCPSKWCLWLSVAEYWYNTSLHSSLGRSPFEVLYGYTPKHFGLSAVDASNIPELDEWLQERQLMTKVVQLHLQRARDRMKRHADKHRSERSFNVGDSVYLKLQPYIQSSVVVRSNNKLSFRFFGPFQIMERVGTVAYRLQLPEGSAIHPVFHVSQLKLAVGRGQVLVSHLPTNDLPVQIPIQVLRRRMIARGGEHIAQIKVRWSGMAPELATWEDATALQAKFPAAPAWGQAGFQERGNVSNDVDTVLPTEENALEGSKMTKESCGARKRIPNSKYYGPRWAV